MRAAAHVCEKPSSWRPCAMALAALGDEPGSLRNWLPPPGGLERRFLGAVAELGHFARLADASPMAACYAHRSTPCCLRACRS